MDQYKFNRVKGLIEKFAQGREVVFWGKHSAMYSSFSEHGIHVSKIFTSNKKILNENHTEVYPYTELKGTVEQYYVVMPFTFDKTMQSETLDRFGYSEFKDYCYFDTDRKLLKQDDGPLYKDTDGNTVSGNFSQVQIIMEGCCNQIEVDESCKNLSIVVKGSGNRIKIGKTDFRTDSTGRNHITISGSDNKLLFNDTCRFTNCNIMLFSDCHVEVGEKSTFASGFTMYLHDFSNCYIGRDCMFSFDACVQCGDGHSIFDIDTEQNINSNVEWLEKHSCLSEINVGDHVWVGRNAMILGEGKGKSTRISNGSIVGAKSLVKGVFSNNVILAGSPAKTIRKNVAWSRKNESSDINDCMGYTVPTE